MSRAGGGGSAWRGGVSCSSSYGFFCSSAPTTEISTLSLHDALPIFGRARIRMILSDTLTASDTSRRECWRSEEHTSELQSHVNLVCRLLLEKKNNVFIRRDDSRSPDEELIAPMSRLVRLRAGPARPI